MFHRQRGLSLVWVAVLMAGFAAAAMAALFSMRYERNFFAEGAGQLLKQSGGSAVLQKTQQAVGAAAPASGALRKCLIDGQTVISNTDCTDRNPTSKTIQIHETRGIEAPKVPKPDPAEASPRSVQDKMIEKATQ